MQFLKRTSCIAFAMLCSLCSYAQKIDSAYIIYQQQFIELSTTRSISVNEAKNVLEKFNANQVASNSDFARLLGSLYPKDRGIGILLFLYHNDTLRRCFFEPGKIIEETRIPITADEMYQLGDQLNASLKLYSLAANRSPKERSTITTSTNKVVATVPFDTIVKRLTQILLPSRFTEQYRHLVIIPSLNIGTLPFHLLRPYSDGSYLIDKCSFTVAPTLIDFVGLRMKAVKKLSGENASRGRSDAAIINEQLRSGEYSGYNGEDLQWDFNNALFVANPVYPTDGKYIFPDLPGAQKEVDSVSAFYQNAIVLKGKAALKQDVIREMNGKEVAYFATHGMSSPDNPKDNSYVVLSGSDPYLTSKQIMDLRLDTAYRMPELIILSACQTGLGKSMEAGVSGSLARSFILAGSDHVITSLWNVDDEATAYLMHLYIT